MCACRNIAHQICRHCILWKSCRPCGAALYTLLICNLWFDKGVLQDGFYNGLLQYPVWKWLQTTSSVFSFFLSLFFFFRLKKNIYPSCRDVACPVLRASDLSITPHINRFLKPFWKNSQTPPPSLHLRLQYTQLYYICGAKPVYQNALVTLLISPVWTLFKCKQFFSSSKTSLHTTVLLYASNLPKQYTFTVFTLFGETFQQQVF